MGLYEHLHDYFVSYDRFLLNLMYGTSIARVFPCVSFIGIKFLYDTLFKILNT